MSTSPPTSPLLEPSPARGVEPSPSWIRIIPLTAAVLLAGTVIVTMMEAMSPSLPLAITAGVALVLLVALTVTNYEAAVALGFICSGIVKIEPAPPDGIFAVVIAVAIATGRFRLDRVPGVIIVLLGAFTALSVFSFAGAASLSIGVRFFAITVYLVIFSIWLTGYADRDRRGRQIVVAWLGIALFSSVLGVLAFNLPGFPMREEFLHYDNARVSALFKDPNVFGPFLIPIAVILLEEIISPRLLRLRMLTGLALLSVLLVGLIFSFSRAAWANMLFATAIMLLVLVFRRRDTSRLVVVLGGLSVVGMAVMAFVVFSGQADFIGQRAQLQQYDTERFGAQRAGFDLAASYPVGVGPGQFQFHHPVETHSTYVRVVAEQGPFGLVLWVAMCLITLGFAIANAMAGRRSAGIGSAALLGAWCGLLFNSVVVDTLHWRHLWVVAALIWAGTFLPVDEDEDEELEAAQRPRELVS